jgi:hypothetical protein
MEVNESQAHTQTPVVISEKSLANGNSQLTQHHEEKNSWEQRNTPILSRMNSMECWDYTIELECLNGPQG